MPLHPASPQRRRRCTGVRAALAGLAALISLGLTGCGDPDGGGSGYVVQQARG